MALDKQETDWIFDMRSWQWPVTVHHTNKIPCGKSNYLKNKSIPSHHPNFSNLRGLHSRVPEVHSSGRVELTTAVLVLRDLVKSRGTCLHYIKDISEASVTLGLILSKITSMTLHLITWDFTTYSWHSLYNCVSKKALICCMCSMLFYLNCNQQYFPPTGLDYFKIRQLSQRHWTAMKKRIQWKWMTFSKTFLYLILFHKLSRPGKYNFKLTWLFQESGNLGSVLRSGSISHSVRQGGWCVCLGSTTSEIKMKYEQRQHTTCYHFKYFLSTYQELNFNKWLQIWLNAAKVI